ncbi:universal stress protein [Chitinispirillales bacterium ANBcel5]|uniref:universal stress protein n=1 Tax=Cellulosispirillum alkaliphilum TaxID=3039283 RepID=UPI002A56FAD3|nr:universal stress protein [Chitinispirillales bacterium ANBcel5]
MNQQRGKLNVEDSKEAAGLRVIHPVHSSQNSQTPFMVALKIALMSGGDLEIVDVRAEEEAFEHISVRSVLERWGVLPAGSHRRNVEEVGLRVKKVVKEGNKKKQIRQRLDRHKHDLMVIGTGSSSSLSQSLPQNVARHFNRITLFVPCDSRCFLNEQSGTVSINSVLLPISNQQYYDLASDVLLRFFELFEGVKPCVIGMHSGRNFPSLKLRKDASIKWIETVRSEPVEEAIKNSCELYNSDLIVLVSKGKNGLVKSFTGSTTGQVLKSAPCPVLSISV